MKSAQALTGIWLSGVMGGAVVLMAAQAAQASAQVTDVRVNSTPMGVDILLQTKGGDRPQVFSVNRGNTWTADIVNTQLKLPQGSFRQANPATGIALVTVAPLDGNSVRVTVTGRKSAPIGKISRSQDGKLVFNLAQSSATSAKATAATNSPAPMAAQPSQINALRSEKPAPLPALPLSVAQTGATPQVSPSVTSSGVTPSAKTSDSLTAKPANSSLVAQVPSPLPPFRGGTPLVPAPQVRFQPNPNTRPVPSPPQAPNPLPRAIAPPVGDIATGQIDATPGSIDLGTAERIPRLVLRDASSREVLSLLARSAGLNIVFTADQSGQPGGQQAAQQPGPQGQQSAQADGPKVTLDIVNEPVQNVFNYVLQVTGLEASRRGNTIFVGPRLPNSARNLIVRSLRLNQIPITSALNFLVGLGAESSISRERLVTSVNAVPVTQLQGAAASAITQTQTTTETRVETQRVNFQDSTPLLRGVQVAGDERTNTITIIGEARKVDVAIGQLTQLDIRRRQVAVNVRVIDINLLALDRLGVSFSFGINQTQVINQGGIGVINFGTNTPASTGVTADLTNSTIGTTQNITGFSQTPTGSFINNFFLQLQAAVTNGSAKILTDPTLVVQEGQKAEVRLTQEVVTNIVQNVTGGGNNTPATVTITVQKASAGLILPVQVDRVDDNGFVSLSIAPSIARPDSSFSLNLPGTGGSPGSSNLITLLSERRVESGQFRLRDGQTLVLSGIIQDEDRTTVTKVPILGDIPILGALFRRTDRGNQRREVIVLVTPRVLDDSDRSAFGYSYTPGPEVQRVLSK